MGCGRSAGDGETMHPNTTLYVEVGSLLAVLVTALIGNVVLAVFVTRNGTTATNSSQAPKLVLVLCVFGATSTVVNIPVYVTTITTGTWIFSETMCQIYGLVSYVLFVGWMWLLVLASLERYTRIVNPHEYPCLFSDINTNILVWSVLLCITISFSSPTYGWGEYSYHRGQICVLLRASNSDQLTSDNNDPSSDQTKLHAIFLSHLADPRNLAHTKSLFHNTTQYFSETRRLLVRDIKIQPSGIAVNMRSASSGDLACLWDEYMSGALAAEAQAHLLALPLGQTLGVPNATLGVFIDRHEFIAYKRLVSSYQDMSTCGLDYSTVNHYIASFSAFVLLQVLIVPAAALIFFYTRIAVVAYRNEQVHRGDIRLSIIIFIASVASLLFYVPFFVSNIAAGRGVYVQAVGHFFGHLLLYSSSACLPIIYFSVMKWPAWLRVELTSRHWFNGGSVPRDISENSGNNGRLTEKPDIDTTVV